MAQTKRKRQTKHRGNAAGVIETRGRTGRKPTAAEKSGKGIGATTRSPLRGIGRLLRPWSCMTETLAIVGVLAAVGILAYRKLRSKPLPNPFDTWRAKEQSRR